MRYKEAYFMRFYKTSTSVFYRGAVIYSILTSSLLRRSEVKILDLSGPVFKYIYSIMPVTVLSLSFNYLRDPDVRCIWYQFKTLCHSYDQHARAFRKLLQVLADQRVDIL